MTDPLLQLRGISKRFASGGREVQALDAVELSLRPGETLAVIGASGSGKSTLARVIMRLTEPDAGTISFDGADLLTLGRAATRQLRPRFQMVFQDPLGAFNPRASVARVLSDPLRVHRLVPRRERPEAVSALLRQVGLAPDLASRNVHDISGGQRQRVAIARAIATRPKLIVLDEAVSALDVSTRADILDLLGRLQRDHGIAYLFVSHDLAVVSRIAQRVAVMEQGRIVEVKTPAELIAAPETEAARALVAAVPRLKYRLAQSG